MTEAAVPEPADFRPEPVFDPAYWDRRFVRAAARNEIHRSIFQGTVDKMAEVETRQLAGLFADDWYNQGVSVLDLGCGYGRLLDMIQARYGRAPASDRYLGVDLSPNLVEAARERWAYHWFQVGDLRTFEPHFHQAEDQPPVFDVGVMLWVRQPVVANAGQAAWDEIERNCRRYCRRLVVVD